MCENNDCCQSQPKTVNICSSRLGNISFTVAEKDSRKLSNRSRSRQRRTENLMAHGLEKWNERRGNDMRQTVFASSCSVCHFGSRIHHKRAVWSEDVSWQLKRETHTECGGHISTVQLVALILLSETCFRHKRSCTSTWPHKLCLCGNYGAFTAVDQQYKGRKQDGRQRTFCCLLPAQNGGFSRSRAVAWAGCQLTLKFQALLWRAKNHLLWETSCLMPNGKCNRKTRVPKFCTEVWRWCHSGGRTWQQLRFNWRCQQSRSSAVEPNEVVPFCSGDLSPQPKQETKVIQWILTATLQTREDEKVIWWIQLAQSEMNNSSTVPYWEWSMETERHFCCIISHLLFLLCFNFWQSYMLERLLQFTSRRSRILISRGQRSFDPKGGLEPKICTK